MQLELFAIFCAAILTVVFVACLKLHKKSKPQAEPATSTYRVVSTGIKKLILNHYEIRIYDSLDAKAKPVAITFVSDEVKYHNQLEKGKFEAAYALCWDLVKFKEFKKETVLTFRDMDDNLIHMSSDLIKKIEVKKFDEHEEEVELFKRERVEGKFWDND